MRKWRQARSTHADVLTGLERAIAAHPAGGKTVTRKPTLTVVTRVSREQTSNSTDAA